MAGYTPVFSSIFDGTLHGKWPQTGVWLALLAMADRNGCVDRTPQAIASDIGISVDELLICISEFMAPDPMSRTRDCDGRRLVRIDADRQWGWRVVNHARYREKARLQAKDSARTESGADAARKKTPPKSPGVPRRPPPAPSPDSDSDSDKNKKEGSSGTPVPQERDAGPVERVFAHWQSEFGHQRAQLDVKRRKVISAAVASHGEASVVAAISGYKLSPHHMGQNERRTVYDDIELFLRDAKHIEAGMNFARGPPPAAMSAVGRAREKLRNGNGNGRVVSEQFGGESEAGLGATAGLLRRLPDS